MKKFLITCLTLGFTCCAFAQKAVDFYYHPEIGKTLPVDVSMKTDIDGPQSMIMDMHMRMQILPSKQEQANITLETTIKSMKVDVNAGMMTMSYNSEEESADDMSKAIGEQFSKIIDQKITSIVTDKGKAVDIQLPSGMAVQGFDPNTFSNMSPSLPNKAVVPGDSWESSAAMPDNPIMARVEMHSTYREENKEGYVIDVEGKLLDKDDQEKGSISGYYILDKTSHFTKNSSLRTIMEVNGTKLTTDMDMKVVE